jgi:hypothetical protein
MKQHIKPQAHISFANEGGCFPRWVEVPERKRVSEAMRRTQLIVKTKPLKECEKDFDKIIHLHKSGSTLNKTEYMKKALTVVGFLAVMAVSKTQAGVLWTQDFSAGGVFQTNYVGAGPNKFAAAQNVNSFNTAGFNLQLTSPTSAAAYTSGLDFGASAGYFQFDFNLISSTAVGQILPLAFGSYSGTASNWLASSIQVTNTATLTWNIRDTVHGVNSSQSFTGAQKITYVINNSGVSFNYDLGSGISGTLVDDAFQVYVGTTLLTFGSSSVIAAGSPGTNIEGFRIAGGNPAAGVVTLDNIVFATSPVPEPSTYALLMAGVTLTIVMVRRRSNEIISF